MIILLMCSNHYSYIDIPNEIRIKKESIREEYYKWLRDDLFDIDEIDSEELTSEELFIYWVNTTLIINEYRKKATLINKKAPYYGIYTDLPQANKKEPYDICIQV